MTKNTDDAKVTRWDDLIQDHPKEKIARRRIMGEHVMVAQVLLAQGFHLHTHVHQNEQFVLLMSGKMRFGIGEEGSPERHDVVISGGEVLRLPPNVPHSADALEDSVIYDVFSPATERTGLDEK